MNITVINGTEKQGITYRLKEMFLKPFRDKGILSSEGLPKLLHRLYQLHAEGRKHLQGRGSYWKN